MLKKIIIVFIVVLMATSLWAFPRKAELPINGVTYKGRSAAILSLNAATDQKLSLFWGPMYTAGSKLQTAFGIAVPTATIFGMPAYSLFNCSMGRDSTISGDIDGTLALLGRSGVVWYGFNGGIGGEAGVNDLPSYLTAATGVTAGLAFNKMGVWTAVKWLATKDKKPTTKFGLGIYLDL